MTLDPELPRADEIAKYYRESGVVLALGHSNANYEIASEALSKNYSHVTHTYNALSGFHHRSPGVMGAVLASDNITAELIADTIHVHPSAMKVLARCIGIDRVVLITDATEGAGLKTGVFELMGHKVFVQNGRSTLSDGTLAGSIATMDQCVRNMNKQVGIPLNQSIQMATLNAARTIGVSDRLGSIEVGKDASITIIDNDVNVYLTMVKGKIAYNNLPL
jgi:N-acetylglucosamine-6-phosphate deacetylase